MDAAPQFDQFRGCLCDEEGEIRSLEWVESESSHAAFALVLLSGAPQVSPTSYLNPSGANGGSLHQPRNEAWRQPCAPTLATRLCEGGCSRLVEYMYIGTQSRHGIANGVDAC